MSTPDEDAAAAFDALRPRLLRIAYRMLGQVADAESEKVVEAISQTPTGPGDRPRQDVVIERVEIQRS